MKRISLVVSLALAAVPALAAAQTSFAVSAGLSVPTGDLANSFDSGYHLQGSINLSPPTMPVGFRLDGTYDNFAIKSGLFASGSQSITGMSGNVVLGLSGLLAGPYVIGGVGYYQTNLTINSASGSENDPGFNIGAGVKFRVGDMGALVEARYVYVNGSSGAYTSSFVPITFGISF